MKHLIFLILILSFFNLFSQQIDTSKFIINSDTLIVFDTVETQDTIYIIKRYKIKVILQPKKKDTIQVMPKPADLPEISMITPSYPTTRVINPKVKPIFSIYPGFGILKKFPQNDTILLPKKNFNVFLLSGVDTRHYLVLSGIGYEYYNEKLDFQGTKIFLDTNFHTSVFEHTLTHIDTIWYLDLDSLLNGDTVWRAYYDTTYVTVYDTVTYQTVDTTKRYYDFNYSNVYKRISIPLFFSYKFDIDKFSLIPTIGFVYSFLIKINGKISDNNFNLSEISKIAKFNKSIFYGYLALGGQYEISNTFKINLYFYSKIPLQNFYTIEKTKFNFYTFGFGIALNFNP